MTDEIPTCYVQLCNGDLDLHYCGYQKLEDKYKRLLKFVRWCKETASCHACDYQAKLAEKLLEELGL